MLQKWEKKNVDIKEIWKHAIMELTLKVKNPYYLGNQQDQCNPYQNASDFFSKTRKKILKFIWHLQKWQNRHSKFEQKDKKYLKLWKSYVSLLQSAFQSYRFLTWMTY